MTCSSSNLVNNFAEGIQRIKCNLGKDDKNEKLMELNKKIASVVLNIEAL